MSNYTRTEVDPTDIKPGDKVEYFDVMKVVESVTERVTDVAVRYTTGEVSYPRKGSLISVYHGPGPTWREKIAEQETAVRTAIAQLAALHAAAPDDLDTEHSA